MRKEVRYPHIVIGISFLPQPIEKGLDRDRERSNLSREDIITHQKQIGGEG
jgi:hypothetical protein